MSPRLFGHVFTIETRKLLSYRVDFWISALATFLVQLTIAYYLWLAVFSARGVEEIGGYSMQDMVVYYVLVALLGRLVRGEERAMGVSTDIYEGSLSRYLVYPSSYFGFKYAEHLGQLLPSILQLVIFGGLAWALMPPGTPAADGGAGAARIAMTVGAIAAANLLHFLISFPLQSVAFWADNVWSLSVMLRLTSGLLGGALIPLDLFPAGATRVLEWLPFASLFWLPVATLNGRIDAWQWLLSMGVTLAWCGVFALVSRAVWRRGLRTYTGVGM